jgi:hypothetical protein
VLLRRPGTSDSERNGGAATQDPYGPGMRARFEAAKKWRERQGLPETGPVSAAMENTKRYPNAARTGNWTLRGGSKPGARQGSGGVHGDGGDSPGLRRPRDAEQAPAQQAQGSAASTEDEETLQAVLERYKVARSQQPRGPEATRAQRLAAEVPNVVKKLSSSKMAAGAALLCTTVAISVGVGLGLKF